MNRKKSTKTTKKAEVMNNAEIEMRPAYLRRGEIERSELAEMSDDLQTASVKIKAMIRECAESCD